MRKPVLLLAGLALALPALALAAGGSSIANAPELPVGVQQLNGRDGADFWRITLQAGDLVTIDFGSTNSDYVAACLLRPAITDYTLDSSPCVAAIGTNTKTRLKSVANPSGRWTLAIGANRCVPDYPGVRTVDAGCTDSTAYEFTAYVKHYTSATLAAPKIAKRGKKVPLRGTVSGVAGG